MLKHVISPKTLLSTFVTASVVSAVQLSAVAATSYLSHSSSSQQSILGHHEDAVLVAGLSFRLPVRASRWRFGGFARGCTANPTAVNFANLQQTLAPIAPPLQAGEGHQGEDSPVDYTISEYPTVFIRVPDLQSATVNFTLQNEDGTEELYATQFDLTGQEEGIIGVQIPTTVAPLEVGQTYAWQVLVSASCGQDSGEFRLNAGSWLKRVAPEGALASIDQVPMRDRPEIYAEAGIWQETVSTLAELRLHAPTDSAIIESWSSLMESVDLGEFATEPILQIYTEE